MKDHLGYLGDECITGWVEQRDYEVQYWEICEHDNGTSPSMKQAIPLQASNKGVLYVTNDVLYVTVMMFCMGL